jgi:hypothetical protein
VQVLLALLAAAAVGFSTVETMMYSAQGSQQQCAAPFSDACPHAHLPHAGLAPLACLAVASVWWYSPPISLPVAFAAALTEAGGGSGSSYDDGEPSGGMSPLAAVALTATLRRWGDLFPTPAAFLLREY